MPGYYLDRVKRMVSLIGQHGFVRDGDRIFELGTGWLHWEALTLRLLFEIEAVLYDVWDNRQLGGLKNHVRQLGPMLPQIAGLTPAQLSRAQRLIDEIDTIESFDVLCKRLGFEYVVESSGSFERFRNSLVSTGGERRACSSTSGVRTAHADCRDAPDPEAGRLGAAQHRHLGSSVTL